jgi:MFS family permease
MSDRPGFAAVLVACCLGFFWAQSSRAVLYAAMPAVAIETGLTPAAVGILTGTLYAGYTVAVVVSGFIPGRRRTVVAAGFLLAAAANIAFALSHRAAAMLVLVAIGGFGSGLYLPRGAAVLVEVFAPERRARAIGWHEVAAAAGLMVAPAYVGAVLPVMSWRLSVALWSAVGLVSAAAVWRHVPDAPEKRDRQAAPLSLDARIAVLACLGGACFTIMAGFFTMLPTLLVRGWQVSPAAAASFTGWTRSSGLAGAAIGGWVADRVQRRSAFAVWFGVMLACVAALAVLDYGVALAIVVMLMTVAATAAATAYYAQLGDAYRPEERERAFGIVAAAASLIGTVATPIGLGLVLDAFGARAALLALVGAPLIGLAGLAGWRHVRGSRSPR